jgi:hypothetical protein
MEEKKTLPAPQLARQCYSIDSSNDGGSSSDSDSLEILSPVRKTKTATAGTKEEEKSINVKPKSIATADTGENCPPASLNNRTTITAISTYPSRNNKSYRASGMPKKPPPSTAVSVKKIINASKNPVLKKPMDSLLDSDSDDDFLTFSRPPIPESRGQTKKREKRDRDAEKERQKVPKAKKLQEEKASRERQKEQEKAVKKREVEEHLQATGKYRHEEVAVLLDPQLYHGDPLGIVGKLSESFLVHSYPSTLSSSLAAIQFVRKDYLIGGAKDAVAYLEGKSGEGFEHLHHLVLILEPDEFIPLLKRQDKEEDDDYPRLESWLSSIKSRWKDAWRTPANVEPTIILMLRNMPEALDKMWVEHRRRNRAEPSLPNAWEFHDAMLWLLVQFKVECILCPTMDLIQLFLHKLTRSLSDKPYANQVTELECVKKIKQGPIVSDDPFDKARDVWLRQLQQVPRLSEAMAHKVIEHYPTCQSLWQAYHQHPHDADPGALLAGILGSKTKTYQRKLSEAVHTIMTSNDSKEMVL